MTGRKRKHRCEHYVGQERYYNAVIIPPYLTFSVSFVQAGNSSDSRQTVREDGDHWAATTSVELKERENTKTLTDYIQRPAHVSA